MWGKPGAGYAERYGIDKAEEEIGKKLRKSDKKVPIFDIMDHVVRESKILFEGTEEEHTFFFIFHDALTQWWEPKAQDYLETLGFRHRQFWELQHKYGIPWLSVGLLNQHQIE